MQWMVSDIEPAGGEVSRYLITYSLGLLSAYGATPLPHLVQYGLLCRENMNMSFCLHNFNWTLINIVISGPGLKSGW